MSRDIPVDESKRGETQNDKLERFLLDIVEDGEVVDSQRDAANEDMRFTYVDGGQWEGFLENADNDADRVRLELDLASNPLNRFIGEWNLNRVHY